MTENARQRLQRLMDSAGYNARALSLAAGLKPGTIYDYMAMRVQDMGGERWVRIAKLLQTTVEYLITGEPPDPDHKRFISVGLDPDRMRLAMETVYAFLEDQDLSTDPAQFARFALYVYERASESGDDMREKMREVADNVIPFVARQTR